MCGIVGVIAKDHFGFYQTHAQLLKGMLYADTLRGADSTGVFGVTKNGNVTVLKSILPGFEFVQLKEFDKFQSAMTRHYLAVIGHNRKATKGDIKPENAHPFKEEHITLVHNGYVYGEDNQQQQEFEVDSHALCARIAKEGDVNALRDTRGAYALVWYDKKRQRISFARNNQRPLWLLEDKNVWILSSEPGIPLWLAQRDKGWNNNYSPIEIKKFSEIPTDQILSFDLAEKTLRDKPRITPIPSQTFYNFHNNAPTVKEEEKPAAPVALLGPVRQIRDSGAATMSEAGKYKIVDSYGEFKKGRKIFVKPVDWNDLEEAPKFVRVIFEIMCLDGTAYPEHIAHLVVNKDDMDAYVANKQFEYFNGEIMVVKVPWDKYNNPKTGKGDVVLQLASDYARKPIGVDCKLTKNEMFTQRVIFEQSTATGCRTCQTPIRWENIREISATKDLNGKYRFYCGKCGVPAEEQVAGAEGG